MSTNPESEERKLELEKVKMLLDYTKFHLGLYLTLFGAIVAFMTSELGPRPGSFASLFFAAAIVCLAVAGGAGGIIGANLTGYVSHTKFQEEELPKLGLRRTGAQWATIEHGAFWLGGVGILVGSLWFGVTEWLGTSRTEVPAVFSAYATNWNEGDIAAVARLWAESGELRPDAGAVIRTRPAIERFLSERRRTVNTIVPFGGLNIQYTERGRAVVDGTMELLERDPISSVEHRRRTFFTAVLHKGKTGWTIDLWAHNPWPAR